MNNRNPFDPGFANLLKAFEGTDKTQDSWLQFESMQAYVRIGRYFILPQGESETKLFSAVQIGNVVVNPGLERTGMFSRMLELIKRITALPIVLENVHNEEFRAVMLRKGFVPADNSNSITIIDWRNKQERPTL